MADPTIQTFCCHHVTALRSVSPEGNLAADLLLEQFHSTEYNAVCIACASVGILGAVYQILPRETLQSRTLQTCRGREIIMWLAAADLMASIGVFIRSAVWLLLGNVPEIYGYRSIIFCAISSAWTQYFYTSTWLWTLCYAVDVRRSLKGRPPSRLMTHAVCWTIPAILTATGLGLLYTPDADCQSPDISYTLFRILPAFCATYVPIAIVMILNPWLYFLSSKDVHRILTLASGQVTIKERSAASAITFKFLVINVSFYVCWLPNLLNGALLWTLWFNLPPNVILALWYIMAVTNPLQAALNALVYRQRGVASAQLRLPCCGGNAFGNGGRRSGTNGELLPEESTPLLPTSAAIGEESREDNTPYWSLNHSCSYL